jgi:hypothetical protein
MASGLATYALATKAWLSGRSEPTCYATRG